MFKISYFGVFNFYLTTNVVVELVKQQKIWFNFPSPFFLVVTSLNPLTVVVRKLDATKNGLCQLTLCGAVVTDSPFQTIAMAQIEYFIAGGNPNGHTQGDKLHWLPIPNF
jgi:uncharacterized membrane protein YhaH (DUF805 family)